MSGLVEEIAAAGLTGRGGAGSPVARKLVAVGATGRVPVVVANGAEGEPAGAKDAYLLTRAPHLVLDGLQLAAEAVGADVGYVRVSAEHAAGVRAAVSERGDDHVRVEVRVDHDNFR